MYRLWLYSLYRLYGPRCPLSPKRPINLISFSVIEIRNIRLLHVENCLWFKNICTSSSHFYWECSSWYLPIKHFICHSIGKVNSVILPCPIWCWQLQYIPSNVRGYCLYFYVDSAINYVLWSCQDMWWITQVWHIWRAAYKAMVYAIQYSDHLIYDTSYELCTCLFCYPRHRRVLLSVSESSRPSVCLSICPSWTMVPL